MRIDLLLEKASPLLEMEIQSAYAELQAYYDANNQNIDQHIAELFQQLFYMGVSAQERGKGAITYLSISYLHSSLNTGTGDFHLALYDNRLYFDDAPVYIYWRPVFLWEQFQRDIKRIKSALEKRFPRLKKYEIEAVKADYAEHFYAIGKKMFVDYVNLIRLTMANTPLKAAADFSILYGGYLDQVETIFHGDEA